MSLFFFLWGVCINLDYPNWENQANQVQVWYLGEIWKWVFGYFIILWGFSSNQWTIFLICFRKFWAFIFELSYPFMEHCQVSEDANRDTLFHDLLERGIRDEMMMNECKYSFVFLQLLLVQLFLVFFGDPLLTRVSAVFFSWNVESNKSFHLMLLYL